MKPRFVKRISLLLTFLILPNAEGFTQSHDSIFDSTAHTQDAIQMVQSKIGMHQIYSRPPGKFDHFRNFPNNLSTYWKNTFKKENLVRIGAMIGITAALVAVDQPVLDEMHQFGKGLGLQGNRRMRTAFNYHGIRMEVPHDLDTALYFLGDGWTHTGIAASFLGYGLLADNNRALHTASQLAEAMLAVAFTTQLLKHITGRESPHTTNIDGGKWRLFPNQIKYHREVPKYDAFPSGHLATFMMTLTVISENYPENKFVRPIGYLLMTILSFQMVNNRVHWISDYPLALSIGYSFGRIAVARAKAKAKRSGNKNNHSTIETSVAPFIDKNVMGLKFSWNL